MSVRFNPGAELQVAHPFIRDSVPLYDGERYSEFPTWVPGIRYEVTGHWGGEPVTEMVADGMGEQILTVISIHKPGRFPTRVFYTRIWKDPDGKVFGKTVCRVRTLGSFTAMLRGYRHRYSVLAKPQVAIAG